MSRMSALNIPVIETERCILRAPEERDFPAAVAFGESERSKWVGGPYPRRAAWGVLLASIGHWALRGYGQWMIEDRATGEAAGRTGFLFNDGWHEPEIGWWLHDGFEGRGLAFEATQAALAYGAEHFGIDGPISYIRQGNTRSAALAERLGAAPEREVEFFDAPCVIWRHPKREAAA
ncbi:GNAT family N-acetyltransferase [Oceanicola sp. D3]|uniref:GNAT family N-acetyltransferase n=1 Tax=Oceanicola sp. D3 TaxID=2587163 RepID=UPI0020C7DF8F|nr:GNAT family N-acetyltransferase [Oceanicola sp. D3]